LRLPAHRPVLQKCLFFERSPATLKGLWDLVLAVLFSAQNGQNPPKLHGFFPNPVLPLVREPTCEYPFAYSVRPRGPGTSAANNIFRVQSRSDSWKELVVGLLFVAQRPRAFPGMRRESPKIRLSKQSGARPPYGPALVTREGGNRSVREVSDYDGLWLEPTTQRGPRFARSVTACTSLVPLLSSAA